MSKRHFIALADFIRDYNQDAESTGKTPFDSNQIQLLADYCHQQNSRFNRGRWLDYVAGLVGPNGGKIKPRVT